MAYRKPDFRKLYFTKLRKRKMEEFFAEHGEWPKRRNYKKRPSTFRLAPAERDKAFVEQKKRCAICRSNKSGSRGGFHADHCHKRKKFRGILCHHCNLMLGHARDSARILKNAINYLKGNS